MVDPYSDHVVLLLPMEGENNSTTFTDVSPSPQTITRYGDTKISTTQAKWSQGSGYFDGTGDYLSIAENSDLNLGSNDFTIEGWIRFSAHSPFQSVFCMGDYFTSLSTSLIFYVYSDNQLGFYGGTANILAGSVSPNTWTHLAVCRSNTTVTAFVNGVSVGIATASNSFSGIVHIGAQKYNNAVSAALTGFLQDIRVTKYVARYTGNFTPPGALGLRVTIAGTCTVSGNGGAQQVVIREASTRLLAALATPDEETGAWSAIIPVGTYDISYFAPDCQPVCHGPYTFTE
jgi:hypothetical protein